jgi:lipoprotein-anchoring transpeptidase ErfK/SrfK
MSALRLLALSYLACASAFVVAATLRAHPDFGRNVQSVAQLARATILKPALDQLHRQDALLLDSLDPPARYTLTITPLPPGGERMLPHRASAPVPPRVVAAADDKMTPPDASATIAILPDLSPEAAPVPPEPRMVQPEPRLATPTLPRATLPHYDIARAETPRAFQIPEPPPFSVAKEGSVAKAESVAPVGNHVLAVTQRLQASLSPEMLQNFSLFIYVSKADRGPLAQRMFVFRKTANNELSLLYDWPASTGRERDELNPHGRRSFTSTPAGYYQLDPDRMYRRYHSWSWDQPMPNAMFFNWQREGLQTGLAIHAATGDDVDKLGQRASAGCVHLSPQNAARLYQLIRADYRGRVPRFAYNADTQTMTNKGGFMHGRDGALKMADGFKVLIDIEDFSGNNVVASLN